MKLIDRYIGGSVGVAALYGVVVLSVVLVLGNIFKELLDLLINRDVPLLYVLSFMAFVLPFSLTFTVPWGFLTAVLLVFGRMSADNEMIALRACGVSLLRICAPVLGLALLLSLFCFWINAEVAPRAEQAMTTAIVRMATNSPESLFVADEVIDDFPRKKIFIGSRDGSRLRDITLIELNYNSRPVRVILAQEGEIAVDRDKGELQLTLRRARFEQRDEKYDDSLTDIRHGVSMEALMIPIPFTELVGRYTANRRLSSYTLGELGALDRGGMTPARISSVATETQKRYSLSLACLAFALIAMPLGITAQRKETSIGFAISLVVAFTYFFFVILAETFRDNPAAWPHLLVWIPNILFIGVGLLLLRRLQAK